MSAKTVTLLAAGTAATAGDKTAVNVGGKTPFLPGRKCRVVFNAVGQTGTAPAYAVDGSDDGTTYTADVATCVLGAGQTVVEAVCYKYMRPSVTTAAGTVAGTLGIHIEGLG